MEIILFELDGARYGLPASAATQVTPPSAPTPLPFMPDYVEGLVSVNGEVAPQIDLRRRLGLPRRDAVGDMALIVHTEDERFAIRIDRVLGIVDLPFETSGSQSDEALDSAFVAGRSSHDDELLPVLNVAAIGLNGLVPVGLPNGRGAVLATASIDRSETRAAEAVQTDATFRCLIVRIGAARYALPLDRVSEVLDAQKLSATPGAPACVAGVVSLRGRPLLVLSLGAMLNEPAESGGQIVLAQSDGVALGFAVERIVGLRGFDFHAFDDAGGGRHGLDGYVNDENGEIIGVIDIDALVGARDLRAHLPETTPEQELDAMQAVEIRRFLTFWVGDELCGVNLDQVVRVHEHRPPNAVPADAGEIQGVTEIGGEVLPVLDLRRSMKVAIENTTMTAQVVVDIAGNRWSVVVDRLNRIVDIPADRIKPSSSAQGQYLAEIGRLDDRLVSLLDLAPVEQAA